VLVDDMSYDYQLNLRIVTKLTPMASIGYLYSIITSTTMVYTMNETIITVNIHFAS